MKSKKSKILLSILFISIFLLCSKVYATDDIIVMLDPGHGGSDTGAVSGGIYEKNVNWKIATRVKEILDNTSGITGILTRAENENPSLYDRGVLARKSGADLLVSFHINASTSSYANGAETYITGNINSSRFYEASKALGESVLAELRGIGINSRVPWPILKPSTDGELYSDGFISDYYGIIRNPMYYGITGVLIEHCYITNAGDRNNYLNDSKINQMAEADARAIIANAEKFRINRDVNYVNSEITELKVNESNTHLTGEIVVVDWINGMQAVPIENPSIKLKSTDGESIINCYVEQKMGNTYYFDTWLSNIDSSKEYKMEVSTPDKVNIPINHTMITALGDDRKIGENSLYYYSIQNKLLKAETKEYIGDLTSEIQKLNTLEVSDNQYFITGQIIAIEWIDGISNVPRQTPTIKLKSTDGEVERKLFIKKLKGNTYYFDGNLNGIDMSKQYFLEIASENKNNLSTNKINKVKLNNISEIVGRCQDDKVIKIKENNLVFEDYTYIGNINSELKQFKVGQSNSASYVSGEIVVVEWVDGVSTVPEVMPKMNFKSVDGEIELEVFVTATGTNTYYFDRFIEGIDTSKEYYFEIESGDKKNISENRKMNVYFTNTVYNDTIVGKYHEFNIRLLKQKIIFEDDTYVGNINSELKQFKVGQSNSASYVSGEIVVVEWVNGKSTVPTVAPKMKFKSTDETVELEVFVTATGTNTYYFDRFIEGIDTSKEYYFEITSGDKMNISPNRSMNVYFTQTKYNNTIIGSYHEYNIRLLKQKIIFEDDRYVGNINSDLIKIGTLQEKVFDYITGEIVIVEWVNGQSTVPEVTPKMQLKSTDGAVTLEIFVTPTGTNTYYFDRIIEGISTDKEYYIEVASANEKNISENKVAKVRFTNEWANKIIGNYGIEEMIYTEDNLLKFKPLDETYPIFMNDDEKETLELINEQRINNGLEPLEIDSRVQLLARTKAQDMVDQNYFDHYSPIYGWVYDMYNQAGIAWYQCGENIAGFYNSVGAVNAWMNSETHRNNILNANYNATGIGVYNGGPYGKIYVQMFIGK